MLGRVLAVVDPLGDIFQLLFQQFIGLLQLLILLKEFVVCLGEGLHLCLQALHVRVGCALLHLLYLVVESLCVASGTFQLAQRLI